MNKNIIYLLTVAIFILMPEFGYSKMIPDQWNDLSPTYSSQSLQLYVKTELQKRLVGEFTSKEKEVLESDLVALGSIELEQTTEIFKKIYGFDRGSGRQLLEWFFSRTKYLKKGTDDDCPPKAYFCVKGRTRLLNRIFLPKTIFFMRDFDVFNSSRIFRLSVLLHEARHLDGFVHDAQKNYYDDVIDGAVGAQIAFFATLNRFCTTCSLVDRSIAYNNQEEFKKRFIQLKNEDEKLLNSDLRLSSNPIPPETKDLILKLKNNSIFVEIRECRDGEEITDKKDISLILGEPCIVVLESRDNDAVIKKNIEGYLVLFKKW